MSLNWLTDPIAWFAFFIGAIIIGNIISAQLAKLGSKGKGKITTKWGMIISLALVGVIWFIFAEQIADLFLQVQQHAVQIIAILLILIAALIYFKKGS